MDRFLQKVDTSGDCWGWLAGKDKDGYGRIKIAGKTLQAHRASWLIHNGPISKGMNVFHRCDNPSCVRPDHLFLGTTLDNNRDRDAKGRNGCSKKTHCPQGHEYSQENTVVSLNGHRKCRVCVRKTGVLASRRYKNKKRLAG